jgi:hopanoid biosynthesis associated RND transporter like protein HpnN
VLVHPPGARSLSRLVRLCTARPFLTIAVGLALAVLGIVATARGLTFQTSSVALLPPHHLYVQRFKEHLRDFGELNDIVVVVEAPSLERAQDFADRLAGAIKALPGAGRVSHRIDPELFGGQALLYLPLDRLAELRDGVLQHRRFIEQYAARPTLAGLLEGLGDEIGRRLAGAFLDLGLDEGPRRRLDPGFIDSLLGVIVDGLDGQATGDSPWTRVFASSAGGGRSGYFLSADRQLLFVLVEPRREATKFTDNEEFIAGIRRTISTLQGDHPDVRAGVTGTPALSNDEMLTAFHDSTVATALACALILMLLLLVFRRVAEPLAMLAVLAISLAWTLGIATVTVGHLTVFSVMFISLLVGIGIDYGIYVFFRYEEERGLGRTPREALAAMASHTGPGIFFGALTAAGTFAVLALTEFRGVQEFGIIAGTAILMAFLAMITVFPAVLVVLGRRRPGRSARPGRLAASDVPGLRHLLRHPGPILVVAAALTAYSLVALPTVRFDHDRLALQARGSESVVWERRIMQSRRSGFAALATADSLAELRDKQAAFERLPVVADVTSLLTVIPADQAAKMPVIRDLALAVSGLRFGDGTAIDPAALGRALQVLHRRLGLALAEAEPRTVEPALRSAHDRAGALLTRLRDARAENLGARLAPVQASLRDDFVAQLHRLQDNLEPRPITARDLPDELTRKFVGRNGRFLMQVYPAIDTWGRDGAHEFVSQLRTVDPAVTGSPVISYEAGHLLETAYFQGTLYALVLVAAFAVVMLGRIRVRDALLALVPLGLGALWTIGAMRLAGLSFNLANVWALPLIVGAAAEYGLNVTLRYREGAGVGRAALPASIVMAVLLNGLTTMAGFGSLMAARHQGIFGLGLLLTTGAAASLGASLVVLPVLLRALDPVPSAARPAPAVPREPSRRRIS